MVKTTAIAACALLAFVSLLLSARAVSAAREAAALDMASERALLAATRREAAALDRIVMTLERRLEELEADGVCRIDVAAEGAALVEEAATHAVDLSRVDVDSDHQSIAVTASGGASALRRWLGRIDGQTRRGCAAVTRLDLSPGDSGELTLRLTALYGVEAIRAHPTAGSDDWPRPAADRLSAAFAPIWYPTGRHLPAQRATSSNAEPNPATPQLTKTPAYLGVISSSEAASGTLRERIVIRLGENGQVVVLLPGESAFGWRLSAAEENRLMMEHEGEHYEISRH